MGSAAVMGTDASKPTLQAIGDYELLDKVAEGGMGAVYRGRHRDRGQIVAVKIMPAHMAQNPVLLKRFEQEFRAASRLDHPNIVRALDYGESGGMPYLVMEFVDGESLGQKIEREGRMPEQDAIRLIAQVAQGLHRAHKLNLVHRDVKPDNVLLTRDGQAKLADLGLVKETETDLNLTKTGRGLGTPHFMAPEQFRNAKNADIRCDVYSLGATLYQVITGELPFRSTGPLDAWMKKIHNDLTPPRQLVPSLSERVNWAILRAMSADPDKRPASCREFIEDLTGRSTRRRVTTTDGPAPAHEVWYLVYRDETTGETHTVKGSVAAIRRSLKDGLLGDAATVRVSQTRNGPFETLQSFPEFRDLVMAAAPLPVAGVAGNSKPPATTPATSRTTLKDTPAVVTSLSPPVAPHLDFGGGSGDRIDLMTWLFLALIALTAAALGAYFFFPSR